MTNFDFLKKIDNNLYEIITEAEKLYTSEFFEQCITQTRRFGEQMCKNIMADNYRFDESFDNMLATMKDKAHSIPEKEFIDDLYFLKKQGNISVHSSTVKRDGILAFECLQRAFEASINYAVFKKGADSNLLDKMFDEKLLATGRKGRKNSIKEEYERLEQEENDKKRSSVKKSSSKNKRNKKQKDFDDSDEDYENNKSFSGENEKPLWREILETIAAGLIIAVVYFLIFNK